MEPDQDNSNNNPSSSSVNGSESVDWLLNRIEALNHLESLKELALSNASIEYIREIAAGKHTEREFINNLMASVAFLEAYSKIPLGTPVKDIGIDATGRLFLPSPTDRPTTDFRRGFSVVASAIRKSVWYHSFTLKLKPLKMAYLDINLDDVVGSGLYKKMSTLTEPEIIAVGARHFLELKLLAAREEELLEYSIAVLDDGLKNLTVTRSVSDETWESLQNTICRPWDQSKACFRKGQIDVTIFEFDTLKGCLVRRQELVRLIKNEIQEVEDRVRACGL